MVIIKLTETAENKLFTKNHSSIKYTNFGNLQTFLADLNLNLTTHTEDGTLTSTDLMHKSSQWTQKPIWRNQQNLSLRRMDSS